LLRLRAGREDLSPGLYVCHQNDFHLLKVTAVFLKVQSASEFFIPIAGHCQFASAAKKTVRRFLLFILVKWNP
jgi:hypothetical protein